MSTSSNESFCPFRQIILHFINVSKKGNAFNESCSQAQLPVFPIIIIIILILIVATIIIIIIFGSRESGICVIDQCCAINLATYDYDYAAEWVVSTRHYSCMAVKPTGWQDLCFVSIPFQCTEHILETVKSIYLILNIILWGYLMYKMWLLLRSVQLKNYLYK